MLPTVRSVSVASLRFSLLTSLGLWTLACVGNTEAVPDHTGTACTELGPADPYTGLLACGEGYSHRLESVRCGAAETEPLSAAAEALPLLGSKRVGCSEQAPTTCSEFRYGYCDVVAATCLSGCTTDNDCDQGLACVCRGGSSSPNGGVCVATACRIDAECPGNHVCAPTPSSVASGPQGISGPQGMGGGCVPQPPVPQPPAKEFQCQAPPSQAPADGTGGMVNAFVCGRPFLVDSTPRVAPLVGSGEWAEPSALSPRVDHLTSGEREALAAQWSRMGQMEHASIAAFARFSLQLLALGAPPSLVEACTEALADETAHARLCFQLASVYAGTAVDPGPLDVGGSLELSEIADIVALVVVEGCFGETSAALDALGSAESATDPVIRQAYSRIARDEQRHAELAFRFVRWALERGGEPVRNRVAAAATHQPFQDQAAREVTLPCLRALLLQFDRSAESRARLDVGN